MIWDHPAKLILFRKLPALPCIQMHRVPLEEHLSLLQHFCTQAACIRGPGHNAECPMRDHFACTLPGFSCQLRAAEKDNAFFPAEKSIDRKERFSRNAETDLALSSRMPSSA